MEVSGKRDPTPLEHGSDSTFDVYCQPCDIDGNHLEAEGYCETCKEYLCNICFKHHKRPTTMKHHVLQDKQHMPRTSIPSKSKPLIVCTEVCRVHAGEIIKYFCVAHDQLGCSECLRQNHRTCTRVLYIPEVAGATVHAREYEDLATQLNELTKSVEQMKKDTEENMERAKQCEDDAVTAIDNFQEKATIFFERLAGALKESVKVTKQQRDSLLQNEYASFNDMLQDFRQLSSDLDSRHDTGRTGDLFVAVKNGTTQLQTMTSDMASWKQNDQYLDFVFQPNEELLRPHITFGSLLDVLESKEPSALAPPVPSRANREKTVRPLLQLPAVSKISTGDVADPDSHRGAVGCTATLQTLGISGSVLRTLSDFELKRDQIKIEKTIGTWDLGSVCKGMCKLPVAIKTLKKEEQESELINEAKMMLQLSHEHIIRMIGVCKTKSTMLVQELAPVGPLNSFLQNHKDISQVNIVELLMQVAMGMAYLEARKIVHRDLAARNVLLITKHFAKISGFWMAKAVDRDTNYYENSSFPIRWTAPEGMFYRHWSSMSDVWSYGVTMWEAISYGVRPYTGMSNKEVIESLEKKENRLSKPDKCDDEVYDIMLHCWQYEKTERPTFIELSAQMANIHQRLNK